MGQIDLNRRSRVDRDIEHRAHGGQQLGCKQNFGAAQTDLTRRIALQLPGSGGRSRALGQAIDPRNRESARIKGLTCRQGQGKGLAD